MKEKEEKKAKEIEELQKIAERLSPVSLGYVIASARAAEFGEQAIREQFGLEEAPKDRQPA
jgi:hypothetical protein